MSDAVSALRAAGWVTRVDTDAVRARYMRARVTIGPTLAVGVVHEIEHTAETWRDVLEVLREELAAELAGVEAALRGPGGER
jgi:hypothetical protein